MAPNRGAATTDGTDTSLTHLRVEGLDFLDFLGTCVGQNYSADSSGDNDIFISAESTSWCPVYALLERSEHQELIDSWGRSYTIYKKYLDGQNEIKSKLTIKGLKDYFKLYIPGTRTHSVWKPRQLSRRIVR